MGIIQSDTQPYRAPRVGPRARGGTLREAPASLGVAVKVEFEKNKFCIRQI
jgi:hypothetical protein